MEFGATRLSYAVHDQPQRETRIVAMQFSQCQSPFRSDAPDYVLAERHPDEPDNLGAPQVQPMVQSMLPVSFLVEGGQQDRLEPGGLT